MVILYFLIFFYMFYIELVPRTIVQWVQQASEYRGIQFNSHIWLFFILFYKLLFSHSFHHTLTSSFNLISYFTDHSL